MHRRFRIGLPKIHRRFRIGPPTIHRRFHIGPPQVSLNLLPPEFPPHSIAILKQKRENNLFEIECTILVFLSLSWRQEPGRGFMQMLTLADKGGRGGRDPNFWLTYLPDPV